MTTNTVSPIKNNSHSLTFGYILWIFGFMGAHRFYYGKPISGCIWFFTLGLLGVGWLVDIFLIPGMDATADRRYQGGTGKLDYNIAWVFLVFLGIFGAHRIYMGKFITGILWFFTGGLFLMGYLYDLLTLNEQVQEVNSHT